MNFNVFIFVVFTISLNLFSQSVEKQSLINKFGIMKLQIGQENYSINSIRDFQTKRSFISVQSQGLNFSKKNTTQNLRALPFSIEYSMSESDLKEITDYGVSLFSLNNVDVLQKELKSYYDIRVAEWTRSTHNFSFFPVSVERFNFISIRFKTVIKVTNGFKLFFEGRFAPMATTRGGKLPTEILDDLQTYTIGSERFEFGADSDESLLKKVFGSDVILPEEAIAYENGPQLSFPQALLSDTHLGLGVEFFQFLSASVSRRYQQTNNQQTYNKLVLNNIKDRVEVEVDFSKTFKKTPLLKNLSLFGYAENNHFQMWIRDHKGDLEDDDIIPYFPGYTYFGVYRDLRSNETNNIGSFGVGLRYKLK